MRVIQVEETPGWKKMLGFVGPGFLVSVAYLDPGNRTILISDPFFPLILLQFTSWYTHCFFFSCGYGSTEVETDLQAGANHKYELLWIVLVGLSFALIIQSRSANLGVATGKHLSEHCRAEYPKLVNYSLWILAEVAVIAADIPEVIGTAFALNLLFNIPIWVGVLMAGMNTLLLLTLQRFGIRKLEVLIAVLVLVMGGCFFAEMARARPDVAQIMEGMIIPRLKGDSATRDAIALLGALIMPHNLFLHSALVMSRKVPQSFHGINTACRYFLMESGLALFVAFLINVAVISVSGSVCSEFELSAQSKDSCDDITLNSAAFLLKNVLGNWSSKVYAVSLLASGQSSTVTGTYTGQFIMQGFLDMKMQPWLRNLITRSIAISPSLVAALIGGSSGAARLIIIASMILSFELPFALIPLLKFTSSTAKMGHHKNSMLVNVVSWALGLCLIGINMYFLSMTFMGWFLHNHLSRVGSTFMGAIVFPSMALYLGMLIYLTVRKETAMTRSTPFAMDEIRGDQAQVEEGAHVSGPMVQELD